MVNDLVEVNKNSVFGFFFQPDPLLGWKMVPGRSGWYSKPGFHTWIRINSHGFRGEDFSIKKERGIFRILVLADSFGAGLEVDEDKLFIYQLERLLNINHPSANVQVINTGTGGYGTEQEYLLLKQIGETYKPDLVLLAFHYGDDILENSITLRKKVGWRLIKLPRPYFKIDKKTNIQLVNYPPSALEIKKAWSYYYNLLGWELRKKIALSYSVKYDFIIFWLFSRMVDMLSYRISKYTRTKQIPFDLLVFNSEETEEYNIAWIRTTKFIEAIRDYSVELNAKFAVCGICTKEQIFPRILYNRLEKFPSYQAKIDPLYPQNKLRTILKNQDIPFFDLYPDFYDKTRDNFNLFFDQDLHWNEQGHLTAALSLSRQLATYM